MNRNDLVKALGGESGLTQKEAQAAVDIFFGRIADALADGERVEIRGFCSFAVREYQRYTGRNPKTGKEVPIPLKKLPQSVDCSDRPAASLDANPALPCIRNMPTITICPGR